MLEERKLSAVEKGIKWDQIRHLKTSSVIYEAARWEEVPKEVNGDHFGGLRWVKSTHLGDESQARASQQTDREYQDTIKAIGNGVSRHPVPRQDSSWQVPMTR